MSTDAGNPRLRAAIVGTILQVLMVVSGHFSPAIAGLFPIVGTGLGGIAGALAGLWGTDRGAARAAGEGLLAGGSGALIGTIISHLLGDVPTSIIAIGTGASAGAGALGGVLGRMIARRDPR
jgi:hypothetical protein